MAKTPSKKTAAKPKRPAKATKPTLAERNKAATLHGHIDDLPKVAGEKL